VRPCLPPSADVAEFILQDDKIQIRKNLGLNESFNAARTLTNHGLIEGTRREKRVAYWESSSVTQ
ncbi:MAG TPA: hypothetical protein VK731_04515, partial [Candidatus Cybelea sp.]|nr:hypothetical protein [Candidatus Cybelea sp.]